MALDRSDFFTKRVRIDDEGYPLLDGVRVADEDSLREIFNNLRRMKSGDSKSSLVTTWGDAEVSVEAFSSPLIIQSIEAQSPNVYVANLLGDLRYEFSLADLQIDEWQRLHLYLGTEQIEATFSRKAQAELLHTLTGEVHFKPFRNSEAVVSQSAHWQDVYQTKRDGWDLGSLSPSLQSLATKWILADKISRRVLIPGAGRGYEAEWLAQKGHQVVAEDFAPMAGDEFRRLNPHSKVHYVERDFFGTSAAEDSNYDAIVELIFFCAIDPKLRAQYFDLCFRRLKPGGLLVGIFFINHAPGGPPFSTTQWELKAYAEKKFRVKHWETSQASVEARLGKEFEVVLQKPL